MTSDSSRRIAALRDRARIVAAIRSFFDRRNYLAVETPQLCRTPIPEAHIELFETHRAPGALLATAKVNATDATNAEESLWLLPSPEYYLKQLLAAGSGNLYEITHSFRNGEEIGRYHDIEFTMLEYYTVDADSEDSLTVTRELLCELGESAAPLTLSMQEAWKQFTGIDLAETIPGAGSLAPGREDWAPRAGGTAPSAGSPDLGGGGTGPSARGPGSGPGSAPGRHLIVEAIRRAELSLSISPEDNWEDLFQRVFLTYIEPELPRNRPVFITDYPAAISTLARTKPGTPWADRWELYLGGVEVANCFGEETDPDRISTFLDRQKREKGVVGHRTHAVDRAYLRSPRLPRCSGVALGVDRLVMHLLGAEEMGDVVSFRP